MKHFLFTIFMITIPLCCMAQESMHIKGNIILFNKYDGKKVDRPERLYYGMFANAEEAEKAKAQIEKLKNSITGNDIEASLRVEDDIKKLRRKLGLTSTTGRSGNFNENSLPGVSYLFMTVTDFEMAVVTVQSGKNEYKDITINVYRVPEVVATEKMLEKDIIGGGITGDPDDGNEYFPIRLNLKPGYGRTDSRMLIQTYAVDCQTEDTFAYCLPIVYEGEKYHLLQNKRMGYDYMKNDPVAKGYSSSIVLDMNTRVRIDTVVIYKKPDAYKKRTFKGPFVYAFEDYHHVYMRGGWEGTCLRERPFKFLDFSPALAQLELTEEFFEEAKSQIGNVNRNLQLKFEVGTDKLTADSINDVELKDLIKDLQSYGDKLVAPKIVGAASPDGSRSVNERLASQRAQKAISLISPYLPRHVHMTSNVKVHSWLDIAAELERKGRNEEAEQIRTIAASGKDDGALTSQMKALPYYQSTIEPLLANQRVMKCSYQFIRQHVMTASECVEEYFKEKEAYKEGRKHFSNGDYYNLFANITDSLELDELTILAYNHIIKDPDYAVDNRIAPYVANRMAVMNLKRGTPNSNVLDPFIDYSRRAVNAKKFIDDLLTITINRREILINQAITYYQEQKLDSAIYLINLIKAAGVQDNNINMLEHYMDLKRFHYLKPRSASQQQNYERAKEIVLNASDENKAILYTEIKDWDMRDKAALWVDKMDDSNPKKWYLKAILAVDNANKGEDLDTEDIPEHNAVDSTGFKVLTFDQEMDLQEKNHDAYTAYLKKKQEYIDAHGGVLPEPTSAATNDDEEGIDIDNIPAYLAYFQHSFDLEPQYKRLYFSEGHVSEDLRRQYKYKKKNIPAYRKLFEALYERDKRKQQEALSTPGQNEDEIDPDEAYDKKDEQPTKNIAP